MQYPLWAPKGLCQYHKAISEGKKPLNHLFDINISYKNIKHEHVIERLIFYQDMKHVWPQLKRHAIETDESRDIGITLSSIITIALSELNCIRLESTKQQVVRLKKIEKASSKLSTLIKNSEFDYSPNRFHPNYKETDEHTSYLEEWQGYTISSVLFQVAEEAKTMAASANDEQPLLRYPNIENALRVAFIRVLSRLFIRFFGRPLYRTLATVSRAVLDDEGINENTVRDALKGWHIKSKQASRRNLTMSDILQGRSMKSE